ncbi:MAG: flagellar basal body rod C-terminal domain-containing protein, partial [Rhodocyclaceae bacterium]|nr:flagellar basal body rod C-terminal domain-containing protein [Rhodocyclaceae bacterium]
GFTQGFVGAANVGDSFLIQPTRGGAGNLALAIVDGRNIAAAAPIRTAAALNNSGTGTVSAGVVSSVTSLPASPITLTYDSAAGGSFSGFPIGSAVTVTSGGTTTAYTIAATTDPVAYVSGATIAFNGMNFVISGAPANNDKFIIERNASGVSDNRNAQLLGALQTANKMVGGTASYQSAYSQIVSQTGNKTREVEVTGKAQQTLADQAQNEVDKMSGVNLDEEAANLLRYQQAYQASAKLIEIAGRLFDEILAISR